MNYGSGVSTRVGGQAPAASTKPEIQPRTAKQNGNGSLPIQAEYQPSGSRPLRMGKKVAADPAPEGLDTGQQGAWDTNEAASDYAKKLPSWNPAKYPLQAYTKKNREKLEQAAKEQKGADDEGK